MQNRKRLIASTKKSRSEVDDRELVDGTVAKALRIGATDAVVSLDRLDKSQIKFANSEVVVSQAWSEMSMDVFLAFGKRVVTSSLNDVSRIDAVLAELKKSSAKTPENKDYFGVAEGKYKYRKLPLDKKIIDSEDALVDMAWRGIEAAESNGADRCAGVLHRYHTTDTMASSRGPSFEEEGASLNFSIRAFGKGGGSGHAVSCATSMRALDPVGAGKEAAAFCKLASAPKPGPDGKMSVLFTHMSGADMPMMTAQFASASAVDAGMSFLKDKIGKTVGSKAITIIDDGTLPDGLASGCADDEGVPTRRTEIIKNGKLMTYLHNTSTAKKYEATNTANAGLIGPRPRNVVVPPGDMSRDELLEGMRDGIVVTNVWYSRFQNYATGDYSTIPRDAILLVKKGEIVGSVKGVRISDNMERMLKGVSALGKVQKQVFWWEMDMGGMPTFVPDMVIEKVNVTKSTK
ncbi:MAG: TldD/PmbA family protein [Methanobacteriota archaeon]